MTDTLPTPKVFISYSWTTEEHIDWVVNLATRLVDDGIDVVLDHWDFKEGHDKYAFMERMVTDETVNRVLIVCDKGYAEKADSRTGGVGTESQIISKDVYDRVAQGKFIPLIRERDDNGHEYIPTYLRNRKYIDFTHDDEFEQSYEFLFRNIFNKPERVKPRLGKPPAHLLVDSSPVVRPASKLARLRSAIDKGKPHTGVMLQEYLDVFLDQMEEFRVTTNPRDEGFYEAILQSMTGFIPYRDSFVEMILLATGYMDPDDTHERLTDFLERIAAYQQHPETVMACSEQQFDNYRFIAYELFLHLIAVLIRNRSYATAVMFIDHPFQIPKTLGGTDYYECGIHAFNEHATSIHENTNGRMAELLFKRATHPKVTFRDLVQADFLLFVRSFVANARGNSCWYPRTITCLSREGTPEIFARATTKAGMAALIQLFNVASIAELSARLQAIVADPHFSGYLQHINPLLTWRVRELLNLDNIARAATS